ncbi:MAG: flagellar type III secretion system pore protein FliP [Desulfonauticus sp.]|nr:flagellar type III secretion system pore protein FliP [Desulfonauticus sp.]
MKGSKTFLKFLEKKKNILLLSIGIILFLPSLVAAEPTFPSLTLKLAAGQSTPEKVSVLLEILFLLTVLSIAPAIILTITSFTRIIIVFSFLRHALGTQQMPPNQVLIALAIFMTAVIMAPVGKQINDNALQPYLNEDIGYKEALKRAEQPIREFLFKHTREKDLSIFYSISGLKRPKTTKDVPTLILLPAYIISELKTGFEIGFFLYIPFLIIDMVVASILLSMGMMMLPPVMISLPFKILLFVMVDGWNLLVGSLVNSFH